MEGPARRPAQVTVFEAVPRRAGDDVVLALQGELDLAGVPRLRRAVGVVGAVAGERVVLDLAELAFIDACGIRAIECARDELGERGVDLIARSPQPAVGRVFGLCGFELWLEGPIGTQVQRPEAIA
jgi:anti-anti-sigma factor